MGLFCFILFPIFVSIVVTITDSTKDISVTINDSSQDQNPHQTQNSSNVNKKYRKLQYEPKSGVNNLAPIPWNKRQILRANKKLNRSSLNTREPRVNYRNCRSIDYLLRKAPTTIGIFIVRATLKFAVTGPEDPKSAGPTIA